MIIISNLANIFLFILFTLISSILIDILFGELPSLIHPVVIIGKIIDFFTDLYIVVENKISGIYLTISTILLTFSILFFILYIMKFNLIFFIFIYIILLSSTFSIKVLLSSANNIKKDLKEDIEIARKSVSYLVSRNTDELDESYIISATIESLSENITDSFISPVFYYILLGIIVIFISTYYSFYSIVILLILAPFIYRIINTLDAMVGYKNDDLMNIGWFPAKLDDILNYLPSRITGCILVLSSYFLSLDWKNSYKILSRDANNCPSPNSGYTMAATAGALNIQLNKKNEYTLGDNNKDIEVNDISNAIRLAKLSIFIFTLISTVIFIIFYWCLK